MRKIIFGFSLLTAFIAAGCTNSMMHQSLLIHENRRLEDALYAAHAQTANLKRENDLLRKQQENGSFPSPGQPRTGSVDSGSWDDDWDDFPPFEMPKVILPEESGTTEVPEWLRGSQIVPGWTPKR